MPHSQTANFDPLAQPLILDAPSPEQCRYLETVASRFMPTHFVSCNSLRCEAVAVVELLKQRRLLTDQIQVGSEDLRPIVTEVLDTVVRGEGHNHLSVDTTISLLWHLWRGTLQPTLCTTCGTDDIRVTQDPHRLAKCGVCRAKKRQAQKLALRLARHGMRNDSISVFCEDQIGNHVLRTLSREFNGAGGTTGRRPTDPSWYFMTTGRAIQASMLADLFTKIGVVQRPIDIDTGHLFATAYEIFNSQIRENLIAVDRAFSLLSMLKSLTLEVKVCHDCNAHVLQVKDGEPHCFFCDVEAQIQAAARRTAKNHYEPATFLLEV